MRLETVVCILVTRTLMIIAVLNFAREAREEIFSLRAAVSFLAIFERTFTDSPTLVCILALFCAHFYGPLTRVVAYKN